jgi:hypothetical protein
MPDPIIVNADEVATRLTGFAIRATLAGRRVVRHHAMLLTTRIKANANLPAGGPPGPRNITGDYNASWTTRFADSGAVMEAIVGTDRPQARRLEYGFVGVDILGRHYNQPAYPHVAPAVEATRPEFLHDMSGIFQAD